MKNNQLSPGFGETQLPAWREMLRLQYEEGEPTGSLGSPELGWQSLGSEEAKAASIQGQSARDQRELSRDLQKVHFPPSAEHWPEHICGETTQGPTLQAVGVARMARSLRSGEDKVTRSHMRGYLRR